MSGTLRRPQKEIFYVEQGKLMAVGVTTRPAFSTGTPASLFEKRSLQSGNPRYDVSPSGKEFIILDRPTNEPPLLIHVVYNWFEEFRSREQTK